MYISGLYDEDATDHRVRYAIANILRDRVANEGAFRICFQMADEDAIIRTILRRGLTNQKLRTALERSHLIDLTQWLSRYPDITEAYYRDNMVRFRGGKYASSADTSRERRYAQQNRRRR